MDPTLRMAPLVSHVMEAARRRQPIDATRSPRARFKEGDGRWTVAAPPSRRLAGDWWKSYQDPSRRLIAAADAQREHPGGAGGVACQARAIGSHPDADRAPRAGIAAGASRAGGIVAAPPAARSFASAGADLSNELDLFGKLARASDHAGLEARPAKAAA